MGSVEPESARVVATARRRSASDIGVISELKVALVPPLNRTELHPTTPLFHRWLGSDQRGRALLICGGFPKPVLHTIPQRLDGNGPRMAVLCMTVEASYVRSQGEGGCDFARRPFQTQNIG